MTVIFITVKIIGCAIILLNPCYIVPEMKQYIHIYCKTFLLFTITHL